MNNARLMV